MAAEFALRLACGLICALLLLASDQIHSRFYRVHFLTALGITVVAAVFAYVSNEEYSIWFWVGLCSSLALCFLGSLIWSIEKAPGGKHDILLTALALIVALGLHFPVATGPRPAEMANAYTSAALLGCAMTAMLLGHSYLIAPSMSVRPLLRMLAALFVALLARCALSESELWSWTRGHSLDNLNEITLLLLARWGMGFLLPLVLTLMAWQTTRIRSTQSSTGILYVVVIFCFIGELMSMVLARMAGVIH